MIAARIAPLLLAALVLAGCDPVQDRAFRTEGPGVELNSPGTSDRTKALNSYFNELCQQADLVGTAKPEACRTLQARDWRALVFTGFNDIDARCDGYLNWLDQKRAERLLVDEGTIAVGALVGGVLGVAAPGTQALNYLALAFGFSQAVYSAYHESILLGIEPSTVKQIVYERRAQFRQEARKIGFEFKPDAVYALRSYLRICMPQTIILNVNEYSRASLAGGNPAADDTGQALKGFAEPAKPNDRIDERDNRTAPPTTPEAEKLFTSEVEGASDAMVIDVQRRLCVQKRQNGAYVVENGVPVSGVDGKVGPQTYAGLWVAEDYLSRFGQQRDAIVRDERVNSQEYITLTNGQTFGCGGGYFRNYVENATFTQRNGAVTTGEREFVADLYAVYNKGKSGADIRTKPDDADSFLGNPDVRQTISLVRAEAGAAVDSEAPAAYRPYFGDALTQDLLEYIEKNL